MSSAQVPSRCIRGDGKLELPMPDPSEWYYLELHVKPQTKQRARTTRKGFAFTPDTTTLFEMRLRLAALQSSLPYWVNGPVGIACYFTLPRPKGHSSRKVSWCVSTPDRDNLEKAVLDALNKVLVRDDEQISFGAQWKMHAPDDEEPMVRLYMFPLDGAIKGERRDHAKLVAESAQEMQRAYNAIKNKKLKAAARREAKKLQKKAKK